jgi:hypothetical protein
MQTQSKPNLDDFKAKAKADAEKAKNDLLYTFSFVPDDKLTWSPDPGARNAIQQVAHCGLANEAFTLGIRGQDVLFPPHVTDIRAFLREGEAGITSREQAVKLIEDSTAAAVAAIEALTPELYEATTDSPFGPLPITFWSELPGIHMNAHACQLDYLQTIWGDYEDHFPM